MVVNTFLSGGSVRPEQQQSLSPNATVSIHGEWIHAVRDLSSN